MAKAIRAVDYFYVQTANKPGEAARILSAVKKAGVNLLAFSGFPSGGRAQLDFLPEDSGAFIRAARNAGLKLSARKKCFLIQGKDRIGVLAGIVGKLTRARINVTALDAVCAGSGRYGAILWVKPQDQRRAAKALGI